MNDSGLSVYETYSIVNATLILLGGRALMIRIASLAIILCFAVSDPALAVSAAVSAACRGDAYRLCSSVIRDEAKRHACMHDHASQLSKGCIAAIRASR
jgi:hypothetical protein